MSGKPSITISDEVLRNAVAQGGSWSDVVRAVTGLQKAGGRTRARVKDRAAALGLDTSALIESVRPGPKQRWSDDELRRLVPAATSWRHLGELLGVTVGATIKSRASVLEIDVAHLEAANHMAPPITAPLPSGARDEAALRVAAESLAAAWYTLHGFNVFEPRAGAVAVDLLVESEGVVRRVQVKSTTQRQSNGSWQLQTVCFQGQGRNRSRAYAVGEIDEVFAVTAAGDMFALPAEVVVGRRAIRLGEKYEKYRVAMFEPVSPHGGMAQR